MFAKAMMTAAALMGAGAAAAAPQAAATPAEEASIAFPQHVIRNFRAVGRDTLYLEGARRQWYRATLMGPCFDLPWGLAIGIDTRGSSSLDRFGTIIVDGERCPIQSLVRSDAPPARRARQG